MIGAKIRVIDGAAHFGGDFACPYCGHINSMWFSLWSAAPEVVSCDCETGGCDAYFAVTARVEVTVTPTARKIEGCEPAPRAVDPEDWR